MLLDDTRNSNEKKKKMANSRELTDIIHVVWSIWDMAGRDFAV